MFEPAANRRQLVDKMPPMTIHEYNESVGTSGSNTSEDLMGAAPAPAAGDDLLGGMDLLDANAAPPAAAAAADMMDLLGTGASAAAPAAPSGGIDMMNDLFGLGSGGDATPAPAPVPIAGESIVAYEANNIKIEFRLEKQESPLLIKITAVTTAPSSQISNFLLQAAVPKTMTLTMLPTADPSTNIDNITSSSITQEMHVAMAGDQSAAARKPLAVRMRISFDDTMTGSKVADEAIVKNFPPGY